MWLLQSRKAQVALGAILTIFLSRLLPRWGFTADDLNVISASIAAVAGVWIAGISHEDAASKAGPQNQTNVNSDVRNQPVIASATTTAPAPQPSPAPVTTPLVTSPAPPPQAPRMVSIHPDTINRMVAQIVKGIRDAEQRQPPPPIDQPKGQ